MGLSVLTFSVTFQEQSLNMVFFLAQNHQKMVTSDPASPAEMGAVFHPFCRGKYRLGYASGARGEVADLFRRQLSTEARCGPVEGMQKASKRCIKRVNGI